MLGILLLCTDLQFATYILGTINCIVLYNKYVTTCFDQLRGHPQATRAHKPKITTENVILSQNEQSVSHSVAECMPVQYGINVSSKTFINDLFCY
jgi:hypothetical protein